MAMKFKFLEKMADELTGLILFPVVLTVIFIAWSIPFLVSVMYPWFSPPLSEKASRKFCFLLLLVMFFILASTLIYVEHHWHLRERVKKWLTKTLQNTK